MQKQIEHNTQVACRRWFDMQFQHIKPLLFSVPNGGIRNITTAKMLQAEGLRKGVPDMILAIPNKQYHALGIEFKKLEYTLTKAGNISKTRGKQSAEQKQFQQLWESAGYRYAICYTLDEFINLITNYLKTAQINTLATI